MSFKSIELQVALPRSTDAGKIQDQMSKEGQRFQESLAQSQVKQDVKKRKTVNKFDKLGKSTIKDEESASKKNNGHHDRHDNDTDLEPTIEHPYLGSKIDFNG